MKSYKISQFTDLIEEEAVVTGFTLIQSGRRVMHKAREWAAQMTDGPYSVPSDFEFSEEIFRIRNLNPEPSSQFEAAMSEDSPRDTRVLARIKADLVKAKDINSRDKKNGWESRDSAFDFMSNIIYRAERGEG